MIEKEIFDIKILFGEETIFSKCDDLINKKSKGYICTINANLLTTAYKQPNYKSILQTSVFNICDGSVIAKILSFNSKFKLNSLPGPDFFISVIKKKKYKSIFVGTDKFTLEKLKNNIFKIDQKVNNMIFMELPFCEVNSFDYISISEIINKDKPDFIWVSLGAPKQEIFANKLCKYIDKGLIVSVGAAFPFFAGTIKRAPNMILKLKLEWFWRLLTEPKKTAKRLINEIYLMPKILYFEYFKTKR
jgi:N-acetylglucosaminyldiphosphoundecaprenol N-acetyl-beta-D-mannosaminyltransferase